MRSYIYYAKSKTTNPTFHFFQAANTLDFDIAQDGKKEIYIYIYIFCHLNLFLTIILLINLFFWINEPCTVYCTVYIEVNTFEGIK